jgi:predicted nucleic acid-binding protein
MTTVSNASPLINLARIGLVDLLHKLYGSLLVPSAVWHEIVVQGAGQAGAEEVQTADWIARQEIANQPLAQALR